MADKTTKVLEVIVDNNKAVSAIAEYNQLIDEQKAKQKELLDAYKSGKLSQADYQKEMAKSKEEVKAYSRSVQELSKEIQNNVKDAQEQEGSLRSLRAQLSNLTKEFDAMSRAERQGDAGQAKIAEINRITNELKEAEEETQRFYRNVGNYPDVKPLEQQLGEIKKQLAQLKYEGKDNTEEFANLAAEAAHMKDALADVEQQINATASDTKNLDTAMVGLTTIMGGLTLLGPMFADGSEEAEKFNKILQKMQAVMMIINTLKTIQNNTQKQGLLYQTAEAAQLKVTNALKALDAKITAKQTAATVTHTVAQRALNLVMKANPAIWLIAVFAALALGAIAVAKAIGRSSDEMEAQNKAIKDAQKALDEYTRAYESTVTLMEKLGASESRIMLTRLAALGKIADESREIYEQIKEYESGWGGDTDRVMDALEVANEKAKNLRDALQEAAVSVRALSAENAKYYAQLGMSDYEKEVDNVNRALADQKELIATLYAANLLTKEEAAAALEQAKRVASESIAKLAEEDAKNMAKKLDEGLKKRQEIAKKETDLVRQALDAQLALIKDENEKARAVENERYNRAVEDLKTRLSTEKDLTKKQREAINQLIELEEQKHQQTMAALDNKALEDDLKKHEEMLKLKLDVVEKGSKEEYELKVKQLQNQRDLELANVQLTEEQKALIRESYQAQEDELRKKRNNQILQEAQDLVVMEWENRIAEAANQGQNTLQLELEAAKANMEALQQFEGEKDAEFKARQLAAERKYIDAKKALNDYELQIQQAKYTALESMVSGLSAIMQAFGEENEDLAKAAKVIALGEIAVKTGIAIAAGIAQSQSLPYPGNLVAMATTVASVLAGVAAAISTVKSAKFATGGIVTGPGTGTSDSIPARLSNGESVINARSTAMFSPLLSAINQAGGGVAFNPAASGGQEGFEFIASAVETGMNRANVRVGVDEITRKISRVNSIKEISKA